MATHGTAASFDIGIVGGGLVGATLACALADTGLEIALFDTGSFDAADIPCKQDKLRFDSRVSAISPASQHFFEELRVWPAIEAMRISPYTGMHVWEADGTGSIEFCARDIHASHLGTIIENSVIMAGLYNKISECRNLHVFAPAQVQGIVRVHSGSGQFIKVTTAEKHSFTVGLLIGADGPLSRVRRLAGFSTREWDYEHDAIVTTVRTSNPHGAIARQRFMKNGPLAFLPLWDNSVAMDSQGSHQHYSSIVWSGVPAQSDALLAMSPDDFATELGNAIEHRLGSIEWLDKRLSFPLRQRHAVNYVQENIALVGDAAHSIHPLAGQGVNLGIQDVKALSREIYGALKNRQHYYDLPVLQRYQRSRKGQNLGMMWLMEGFKQLFEQEALPVRWLRNTGMRRLNGLSFVKNRLMRAAMGVPD